MDVIYLHVQLYNLAVLHVAVDVDTSVQLFAQVTLKYFESVLRCPNYVVLTPVIYVGSGFISAHVLFLLDLLVTNLDILNMSVLRAKP
jgi:hypothetical protein